MRIRASFSRQVFLAVALAVLVPALFVPGTYGRHLLTLTLIYCTLGVSLNLVMGYAGLVSVAHGAFFGIGAYTTALMTVNGYGFTISVIAGMALAAATGTLVGLVTLRLRGHYFALATLAFTMTVVTVLERWDEVTRGSRGISDIPRPSSFVVGGFDVVFKQFWPMYLLVLAVLCLALITTHRLVHSPFGRALQCVQRNELLGRVFGVNVVSAKLQALALSAALASASGSLYASYIAYIAPADASFMRSFDAIMFVVVGGAGTIWGPVLGTFFIQFVPEVLRGLQDARLLVLGLILVGVVRFYPAGLSGLVGQLSRRLRARGTA